MNASPNSIPEATLNPMELVFSLSPTFVARGHSGDIKHLTELIKAGFQHDGFAYIDVLQACPTYNKFLTSKYLRDHCYRVEEDPTYDVHDFERARAVARDTTERVAIGILYRAKDPRPNFLRCLKSREGRTTTLVEEVQRQDISEFLKEFV
jgi:2-oxoglutarate ferredoxin oxidoreductase subunit beta